MNERRKRTLAVIMGGGRGTRLSPLTLERCKPAVPLAGKYRLVDIPISNCINSEINRIFILSQFQTASLHRHVQSTRGLIADDDAWTTSKGACDRDALLEPARQCARAHVKVSRR